jgi:TonB-dependent receptor
LIFPVLQPSEVSGAMGWLRVGSVWRLIFVLCVGWALEGEVSGQSGQLGALRGRVVDSEFYQGVPGADLSVEGTQFKVVTEDDGSFFLNELPPGVYSLLAARQGFTRERVSGVVVSAGVVSETEVRLTPEVVELDDFVVSMDDIIEDASVLSPTSLAADLQSFSTALGTDFLAKIAGGGDISGAVTRLAGTSVVDSRYVVIRGLSDRYNVVVLNGARIPSSDPDRRAVNIDIFPSTLVETIVSSKTFTPDMPGEATGGFLNVITKSIPSKPFVNIFLETGYNTQSTGNPGFLQYSGGGTGMFGTARQRSLPTVLKNTTLETLPPDNPTFITTNPVSVFPDEQVVRNRSLAASLLGGRGMGASTAEAPMDFAMSLSAGTVIEDFMNGRLGVVGALAYSKRYELDSGTRGSVSLGFNPDGSIRPSIDRMFSFQEGEEKLLAGALLSIGWEGTEQDKIGLTFFTNIAAEDETVFAVGEDISTSDPNNNLGPFEEGLPIFNETLYYTERKLSTLQLTGEHVFDDQRDIKIDWAAAYSWSSQEEPDVRFSNYGFDMVNQQYFGLSNDIPGERFERIWRKLEDQNYNINLNIEIPLGSSADGKERSKIKFGGAFENSQRQYVTENFAYKVDYQPTVPYVLPRAFTANNRQALTLADQIAIRDGQPSVIGNGFAADGTYLTRTKTPPPTEAYTAYQDIGAVYAMATFNMSPDVEILMGGRVETTDIKVRVASSFDALDPLAGGFIFNDLITGQPIPRELIFNPSVTSTDFLPALGISWNVTEKTTIRSSVTRTIARPTFKEIAPVLARDPTSGDFFVGNVRLNRSEIMNYDLRAEWFPQPEDFVILSVFSKSIRSPIEFVNLGPIDTVFNEDAATIYGFEIELSKKLTEWGPFLENISLGFNYAKMKSQVELNSFSARGRQAAGLSTVRSLQGQPDYTMNFNAIYDDPDFGLTMGVFLNITGELLYQVGGVAGGGIFPDVVQETYTRLDFNISKVLFDDWKLGLRVGNFLNTERRRDHRYDGRSLGAFEFVREGTLYALSLSKKW